MTLLRKSTPALLAFLLGGCVTNTGDEASSASSSLDESSLDEAGRPRGPVVVLADLVGLKPGPEGRPHILAPFHLPPPKMPPPDAPAAGETPRPPPCVVFHPAEAPKPPEGDKCGPPPGADGPKPPPVKGLKADEALAPPAALEKLDLDGEGGLSIDLDPPKPPLDGPTVLQIAVFDSPLAEKPGEKPRVPDAVLECFAPAGAPKLEASPKHVMDLLRLHRIEGAVARVAIAHFPPPPKEGPTGKDGPMGPPPPKEGAAEGAPMPPPPEGARPLCHPPVLGRGTFTIVPLHPPKIAPVKPIDTSL